MVFCAAINCSNSSNKQKTYEVKGWHKVPVKKELRKKWITAMKRNPPIIPFRKQLCVVWDAFS